jgi:chromosomal replication initiator protein
MHLADEVLSQTAEVFGRTRAELVGRSRQRSIVEARQAAMWAMRRRYPSLSLETIGMALGGRHYSTVMHALVAVEERAQRRVDYRVQLQHVMERVSPRTKPARLLSRDKPLHRAGS